LGKLFLLNNIGYGAAPGELSAATSATAQTGLGK